MKFIMILLACSLSFLCEAQIGNGNARPLGYGSLGNGLLSAPVGTRARETNVSRAASAYEKYSRSIVLFSDEDGGGATGFIVREDNAWWIYTNRHVAKGVYGKKAIAQLIDGTRIPFSFNALQLASDRDLARFRISPCKSVGIAIAKRSPVKDESIVILGNSSAEGVITEAKGKILGYGPTELEHDADTAQGNSGSPIIASDGTVIGVDTRGRPGSDEILLKGSRYRNSRSFGTRINDVPWVSAK